MAVGSDGNVTEILTDESIGISTEIPADRTVKTGRPHVIQSCGIGCHRHIPHGLNAGIMEFHIKFPVENIDFITGIDCRIGIEHYIRTVVDPGDISDSLFLTYL